MPVIPPGWERRQVTLPAATWAAIDEIAAHYADAGLSRPTDQALALAATASGPSGCWGCTLAIPTGSRPRWSSRSTRRRYRSTRWRPWGIFPLADAFVRLGLDPSGVVAGAQAASAGLTPFVRRVQNMPAALRPVSGAVDGLTARYRVLGRVARASFDEQVASARRAATSIQTAGKRAGEAFGTTLAAGVRSRSGAAVQATARVTNDISAYLPQSGSGARRGPLANLTRSGRAIPETLAVGVRSGSPALRSAIAAMTAQVRGQLTAGLRPPAGAGAGLATLPAPSRGGGAPVGSGRGSAATTGGSGGQFEVLPVTRGGVAALPAPGRGTAVPLAGAAALPAPAGLGGGAAPVITNRAGVPVSAAPAQQAGWCSARLSRRQWWRRPPSGPRSCRPGHPARDRVAPGAASGSTCASGGALHPARDRGGSPRPAGAARGSPAARSPAGRTCRDGAARSPAAGASRRGRPCRHDCPRTPAAPCRRRCLDERVDRRKGDADPWRRVPRRWRRLLRRPLRSATAWRRRTGAPAPSRCSRCSRWWPVPWWRRRCRRRRHRRLRRLVGLCRRSAPPSDEASMP